MLSWRNLIGSSEEILFINARTARTTMTSHSSRVIGDTGLSDDPLSPRDTFREANVFTLRHNGAALSKAFKGFRNIF
jgi:hypothetical protein